MAKLSFWRSDSASMAGDQAGGSPLPLQPVLPRASAATRDEALALLNNYEQSGQGWFWSTDAEGRITYLTGSVASHLRPAAPGGNFADLFLRADDDSAPMRTLAFLLAKQSKFERLVLRSAYSEDERWWSLSGTPQFDSSGQFTGYRGVGADITEERRSSKSASQLALSDALTGLPNRLRMGQVLESNLAAIDHHKRPCAVMLLDLDRFKQVNDTLGHPAGDALLQQVAERLIRVVGEGEKVFRLGGDEFEIILRDCDDRGELGRIANDVIALVSQPYSVEGSRCIIGASIGIAIAPFDGQTADALIRNADLALYAAKGAGRGRFHFFSEELLKAAEDKRLLESDLRDALAKGEIDLAYQPIVCATENCVKGVEALIRWRHPVRGLVSPAIFIPIAEEANLIEQIGEWIVRKACEDAATWPAKIRVAVNVSPAQFGNEGFPGIVMSALTSSGLAPERLELEITEGVFLGESAETDTMFAALKSLGVRLALDDFGTGYSSLSYLKTAPFDKIKIDQSFVRQATLPGSRNGAIIAAIVALAEALGMETTAEGIESLDQLELVRSLRVSHIQGFVYSPGVETGHLSERLEAGDWVIEPAGPAKQRSSRQSLYRRVGAIFGNQYQGVLIRNLSETGALIEGLPDLPVETLFIVDFGGGELVFARVRRAGNRQHGVEFEQPLVSDGNGGFCARHRVSHYALASLGLPEAGYSDEAHTLHLPQGATIEHVAQKLGLDLAAFLGRAMDGAGGLAGQHPVLAGMSIVNGGLGDRRLSSEDVQRLLEAARASQNPHLKHIVTLLVLTGARQRELLEARWDHFDLVRRVWNIPDARAGKSRTVRLTPEAVKTIGELPRWDDCAHLIANPKTKKPYRSFTSSWETARKKAGLPYIEIDELRHAARG